MKKSFEIGKKYINKFYKEKVWIFIGYKKDFYSEHTNTPYIFLDSCGGVRQASEDYASNMQEYKEPIKIDGYMVWDTHHNEWWEETVYKSYVAAIESAKYHIKTYSHAPLFNPNRLKIIKITGVEVE